MIHPPPINPVSGPVMNYRLIKGPVYSGFLHRWCHSNVHIYISVSILYSTWRPWPRIWNRHEHIYLCRMWNAEGNLHAKCEMNIEMYSLHLIFHVLHFSKMRSIHLRSSSYFINPLASTFSISYMSRECWQIRWQNRFLFQAMDIWQSNDFQIRCLVAMGLIDTPDAWLISKICHWHAWAWCYRPVIYQTPDLCLAR